MNSRTASILLSLFLVAGLGYGQEAPGPGSPAPAVEPEAAERAILRLPTRASDRALLSILSSAGIGGGMALAAWGVSTIVTGIGNDFDGERIHQGIALTISGSLMVSFFSVIFNASAAAAGEGKGQEAPSPSTPMPISPK
jgi:hypothetical protein